MPGRRQVPSVREPSAALIGIPTAVRLSEGPIHQVILSRPITPRFLRGYLDLALSGTLGYARYDGWLVGSWSSLPLDGHATGIRAWIRPVSQLRTEVVPESLGSLVLVTTPGGGPRESARSPARPSSGEPEGSYTLRVGLPRAVIHLLSARPTLSPVLDCFGFDLAERFRRQLD